MRGWHFIGATLTTAAALGWAVACASGGEGDGGEGGAIATGGQSAGGSGGVTSSTTPTAGASSGGGGAGGASGGAGGQGGDIGPCGRCRDRLNSASLPPCPGTSADLWEAYWGCLCTGLCAADCGDNVCQGGQESGACQTCRMETGLGCGSQYNACLNDN